MKYDGKFASRWRAKSTDALCAVLPIIIYTGDFPLFCPIRRYFLLGDKNSIQYHVADSHAAAFSIGSLSLRYTVLPLPMISYDICFYFRMERILWLLPIAHLSNHFRNLLLHTLFSCPLLYHFFAMNTSSEDYTIEALKTMVWRYFMSYWSNRRICSAIGGIPPAVKRRRFYSALTIAA